MLRKTANFCLNALFSEPPFPTHPFGTVPRASRQTYLELYENAKIVSFPEMDEIEQQQGFAIDRRWLDEVALHTQIVIKESKLNYQHGRMLYAMLRRYIADTSGHNTGPVTILETGTARGFSALCMARALIDANAHGIIVTIDILPHNIPILWNCIDDHDGPKTRQQLLSLWRLELDYVVFIQGWTRKQLARTGLSHINFAFLDAQHTAKDVMAEYTFVRDRQQPGDKVIFDDVTPGHFDGVVRAVEEIEAEGLYLIERIQVSGQRGYAVATRLKG